MEFNDIKKIIEEEGGKIIIPGENSPTIIIMSLDEYKKGRESRYTEKIDSPSIDLPITPRELENESLRIEDLPF
jgi:hypothetical protein